MSGRTIRTRAAASTGGKMPKALANKKATPAQAKGTNRSSGGKASTQARKAAATSVNKAAPAGRKGKAEMAMAADSEADEDSDEVPLQTDSDEAFGEAGADNASDNDSAPENVMVISSDDDQSTRPEVELTPKIARRRSTGSSPPSTPKTPSPVKRGRGGAAKAKATPGKRAKESDSDEEIDEGISPLKKAKKASTPVQARIPLPRRQTIAAMIAAEKAELAQKADKKAVLPQKVDKKALPQKKDKAVQTTAFPSKPTVEVLLTSRKASAKAMSSKKAYGTAKAPDSAAEYFMDETDDEDKARLQRRLFIDHVPAPLPTMPDEDDKETANISQHDSDAEDNDETMQDLADDVTNKLILDVDDAAIVDPTLKHTYSGLPVVQFCEAVTSDGAAISTVPYTEGLVNGHDVNPSALQRLITFVTDGGYVINPARFDPAKVMLTAYGQSVNKVLSWKPQSGGQPVRAICMTVGYVFTCNVANPASFGKMQSQTVKSILFGPVRAEWERTMGFFGSVFNRSELPISTFSASQKYIGVNMRTFPSDPAPALPDVSFISATPSKRGGPQGSKAGSSKVPSVPSRSLLEMRDKTTWNTHDHIGLWDGTEYFKKNKRAQARFSFDEIHKLPELQQDPMFGDIVIVLYSTSSYVREDKIHLSLNLYGVVLVARGL